MRIALSFLLVTTAVAAENDWSQWRGPNNDGMAKGDAPVEWSPTKNVAWKLPVPGRGHSSPVVWGNKLFITTAVPVGPAPAEPQPTSGRPGRSAGMGSEYSFRLLCIDRNSGKLLWEREATKAAPH